MTFDANGLLLFARVVKEGSFTRAADRLGIPSSTLSRRILMLEAELGERLLLRTTRKLTVTEFGHEVLVHADQVTEQVAATLALSQHRQMEPGGWLRISMPGDLGTDMIGPLLADFRTRFPAVTLEVNVSQHRIDLIGENYDVALRIGDLPDDTTLVARRIGTFQQGLYASPAFLADHGPIISPEGLENLDALYLRMISNDPSSWKLMRGAEECLCSPPVRAVANSPGVLKYLALAGGGIACLAEHFAKPQVASGGLQRVLEEWKLPSLPVFAVFPGRRLMPTRTRMFIDALQESFANQFPSTA